MARRRQPPPHRSGCCQPALELGNRGQHVERPNARCLTTVSHWRVNVTLGIRRDRKNGGKIMVEPQPSARENGTVRQRRAREHLTEAEIEKLMAVARRDARYGHRDATAILVAYRHGLRASELVDLQWDQIDFVQKTIRIHRVKNGTGSTHYLGDSELRALRRLQRGNPPGPHVFVSERGGHGHDGMVSQDDGSARRAGWHAVSDSSAHAAP